MDGGRKKGSRKPLIIALVAVVVLALAITGGVLWKRHADEQAAIRAEEQRQATIARKTELASGVVTSFVEALGEHDVDTVKGLTNQPIDSPGISTEVLAATYPDGVQDVEVTVQSPIDETTVNAQVAATFGSGTEWDAPETVVFDVWEESEDRWSIEKATVSIFVPDSGVKLNGAPVANENAMIEVLPGTYQVTPANPHLVLSGDGTAAAYSFDDTIEIEGDFVLSPDATKQFRNAAKASITECMKKKSLDPPGCPWIVGEEDGVKVDPSTITYKLLEDPWSKLEPIYGNYGEGKIQATGSLSWKMRIDAQATYQGRRGATGVDFTAGGTAVADLTQPKITVTWAGF